MSPLLPVARLLEVSCLQDFPQNRIFQRLLVGIAGHIVSNVLPMDVTRWEWGFSYPHSSGRTGKQLREVVLLLIEKCSVA